MLKGLLIAIVVLAVGAVMLWRHGQTQWSILTDSLHARLDAAREPPRMSRAVRADYAQLPPVVRRYFEAVLPDGAPIVTSAFVEHSGTFDTGESAANWAPFRSRQRVIMHRPGFVWDGRITMAPLIAVHVHDAYIAGEGILHPAILGLFSLADLRGGGEIAEGELMRFLAESAWYPTALLPGSGVQWDAADAQSARATVVDGALSVSMVFTFDDEGLIRSVRADARGRTVGGRIVPTPWEGKWSDYQWRHGMRVPITGEVAWLLPEGRKPYWRGTITELRYEFARGIGGGDP